MRVHFFEPKAADRVGGLDAAIEGMRDALRRSGMQVDGEGSLSAATDVAHFHGLWQPRHSWHARQCIARGIPYIVSPHGMLEPWAWEHKRWKKWPYFQLVEQHHLAHASALLATAQTEADRLRRFFPRQCIEPLPLGVSGDARPDYERARALLGWKPDERVLLFLSRIHVKKGLDLLLEALARLPSAPQTRLVVVGDGKPHYVEHIRALARSLAPKLPRIDWIGAVWGDARWPYFQGADLFCLPTHSENFGCAVLESCQVGTPVLTTVNTPWKSEISIDRGYITEPNVPSVQARLAAFFAGPRYDQQKRERLAEWAWRRFHWDTLAPRYVRVYQNIVKIADFGRMPEFENASVGFDGAT